MTTLTSLLKQYRAGEPISMVTCYDYSSAVLAERAGMEWFLVGDSLGWVMHGRDSALGVTIDDIVYHAKMVMRARSNAFVTADLPFLTYASPMQAVDSVRRVMGETGVHSVKLEGGAEIADAVRTLAERGVPVVGHLGLTPQSQHKIGLKVQARALEDAKKLISDARALQEAGIVALVLECIPDQLAAYVTKILDVPTIGIGSGAQCSGQVQVWHDLLGLNLDWTPKHAKNFAPIGREIVEALENYRKEVSARSFPTPAQTAYADEHLERYLSESH